MVKLRPSVRRLVGIIDTSFDKRPSCRHVGLSEDGGEVVNAVAVFQPGEEVAYGK
jgi:hypothetical protein